MRREHFKDIKAYTLIVLGLFINALSWVAFLIPSKIVGGGVAGIGSLLYFQTGFPLGFSLLIANAILVGLAIKRLGASFGLKTILGIAILSGFMAVLQPFFVEPIVTDRFMAAIIGGILAGVSIGMIFTQGGSTGGTDIIAMLVTQKYNVSPGKVMMYCDIVIIASSFLIFRSIETIVYGYVTMGVTSYVIDMLLVGSRQSIQLIIVSKRSHDIAEYINTDVLRGVTILKGQGWFSKEESDVLLVLVRKHELQLVFRLIKEIDGNAFISVSNVMGVYGKGFDRIRG